MSQKQSKGWPKILTLGKKANGGYYLVVDQDITLKKGKFLHVEKPTDRVDRLLKNGIIDEAEAEQQKARIPAKVVLNVFLPDDN